MLYALIPVLVGVAIVIQNGLNLKFGNRYDLASALFLNCIITVLMAFVLFIIGYLKPQWMPAFLRPHTLTPTLSWWMFIPGLCGFVIISSMPIAFEKMGALKSLALLIAVQLAAGIVWDFAISRIPISIFRILGTMITLLGALIAMKG